MQSDRSAPNKGSRIPAYGKYLPSLIVAWIALTFVFAMLAIRVVDPSIVKELRNSAFDRYQQIKPREYTPQPVRIIDIDEESLRRYGQWPIASCN